MVITYLIGGFGHRDGVRCRICCIYGFKPRLELQSAKRLAQIVLIRLGLLKLL